MTETIPKPELREEHTKRTLTQAEFAAEATRRFGADALNWAYVCPSCGTIAAVREWPKGQRGTRAGIECIGALGDAAAEPRGCMWIANEPTAPGPWIVHLPDGSVAPCFALAPAPSRGPQSLSHDPEGIVGHADDDIAPDATIGLARALSLECRDPGKRREMPGGGEILDMENWHYRVALTDDQAIVGYRDAQPDRPVTVMLADSAALLPCAFHDLAPDLEGALRHIAEYDLPIREADLVLALSLIVQAHAESLAAAETMPIPTAAFLGGPPAPFWTQEDGWTDGINCSCHISAPCVPCESPVDCGHCGAAVPADDMSAHLDAERGDCDA